MKKKQSEYYEKLKDPKMFLCSVCHKEVDVKERYGTSRKCKPCFLKRCQEWRDKNKSKTQAYSREWQRKHPECAHKHKLKHRYSMSIEEYNNKLKRQKGVCAICGEPETKIYKSSGRLHQLSVDHNHITGENRGLLCDSCNKAIGLFKENVEILKRAIEYMETYL